MGYIEGQRRNQGTLFPVVLDVARSPPLLWPSTSSEPCNQRRVAVESYGVSPMEEGLLREGSASYWLALAAIKEYQALVWRRCREVVKSEQLLIAEVAGSPLKDLKDLQQFDAGTQYAALGIRAGTVNGCANFFALWWEKEKLYASVWTEFKDSDQKLNAWSSLHDAHGTESAGSNATEIWFNLDIPAEEAGNPWGRLSKCIQLWSQAWGRVPGGLKQYL